MDKVDINIISSVLTDSTIEIYRQLIGQDIFYINSELISEGNKIQVNLASVIGITGTFKGQIILSLDEKLAFKIASAILMGMEINEYNEMVASSVCEMINMISGEFSRRLTDSNYNLELSVPSLITGLNVEIFLQPNVPIHLLNFDTPFGKLKLFLCVS